jgi:hypothetical protein
MHALRLLPCAGALIGLFVLPLASQGAVLTFTMEGHITQVIDPLKLLTFAGLGDKVTYTFSFDSKTPDTNPTPTLGIYQAISASARVKDTTFDLAALGPPTIEVQHPLDLYDVASWFSTGLPDLKSEGFAHFVLSDQDESNALIDDSLPLLPLDLTPFASRQFGLQFWPSDWGYNPPTLYLIGNIESFTPEPACMTSLLLGLVFCRRNRLR